MVTSDTGQRCAMVQLYCSEQIAIPESFPNILKTYAKAAIRTQPYDILRWSAAYFRCLANNATPPAKIRLERNCRQGSLTRGYLKVLVAQVGKGFFISRCLLQERWKALCLPEDDLLKYLSLCRMLNWPQVHWLKVLAVMIGSLSGTPHDAMAMVCELLTDDVEGGLARIPYWMFKICYCFVAKLDCSQEQCFVNGQKVLPWGDLEEATSMDRLPQVLSATLLKDTIITSCRAKFDKSYCGECPCSSESSSSLACSDFMAHSQMDDPKKLLDKCDDFDTIIFLLHDAQEPPLTEEDFNGPHYISEKQLKHAKRIEETVGKQREQQANLSAQAAADCLQQEAYQMLREVGPPWTWLHQFTTNANNTASYNFIDQESIRSDATPDAISTDSFDLVKEKPKSDKDTAASSSDLEMEERKCSLESLKSVIEDANKQHKCDLEQTSSIVSFLKSEELGVLQRAGEPFKPPMDLNEIVGVLERAAIQGTIFTDVEQIMQHIKTSLFGDIGDFPAIAATTDDGRENPSSPSSGDMSLPQRDQESISIPEEWAESISKQDVIPQAIDVEKKPEPPRAEAKPTPKDEIMKVFEKTVGIPPEQAAKMPKFCSDTKDEDELVLGLVPLSESSEVVEEEDTGSTLPASGRHSGEGYRQDDFELLGGEESEESEPPKVRRVSPGDDMRHYCCVNAASVEPLVYVPPPVKFHCTIKPYAGIGAPVSQQTIDEFLAFLRVRSRSQRGLINPRNFKEERCPHMVDTTPMH